jgi:hypothetical protein
MQWAIGSAGDRVRVGHEWSGDGHTVDPRAGRGCCWRLESRIDEMGVSWSGRVPLPMPPPQLLPAENARRLVAAISASIHGHILLLPDCCDTAAPGDLTPALPIGCAEVNGPLSAPFLMTADAKATCARLYPPVVFDSFQFDYTTSAA